MNIKRATTLFLLTLLTLNLSAQRPGYWAQRVDYTMDIDVDETTFRYDGKMKLKYSNNSDQELEKVYFHLYFNAFQPGSMMDERLQNIRDPDSRMVTNEGTKEKPIFKSRIASLTPENEGYQHIKSVEYNGNPVRFQEDGTVLEVLLDRPISAGQTVEFDLLWEAQVPEQIRRSGRNSREDVAFSMTQWYPKMAHFDEFGWHLDEYIGREFVAPFGNFDVTIRINEDYVIGSSGKLQNPGEVKGYQADAQLKTEQGKATWHYKAENIHDFAWAADPKFVVDSAKTQNGTSIYTVYIPTDDNVVDNWTAALGLTVDFFDFVDQRFGKYPWSTYTVIQGGDGGMEYGTATLITGGRSLPSLVGVIYHEAAHSWYQQLFGINETVDEWMDEGFTSYMQTLAFTALFEKPQVRALNPIGAAYNGYYRLATSGLEEPMSLLADYYHTNFAYSQQAYNKGGVLLEQLGYIIGKEKLHETFLNFYDQWKFSHPTPNDFKRVAEETADINLKWYFNLFVNTTRTIDYAITAVSENAIEIQNKSNFAMPIDLLVEYEDGSKELFYIPLREMRGEKSSEHFDIYQDVKRTVLPDWFWTKPDYTVPINGKVKKAQIDPTERLADVHPEDNLYER